MCGIIGYIGTKEAAPILLDGLKRLEYRGYDSAGISISRQDRINTVKVSGRVKDLESVVPKDYLGTLGIAHTRWATHGAPVEKNAHPHLDCSNTISVVHNGIIENYHSLRELLRNEGHVFRSETDSEVVAHLIEKFYTDDLTSAVLKAISFLEGTYGLVVLHAKEKALVAVRKGSPLVLGLGTNEFLVSSDPAALLSYTRTVIYLKDNEVAHLTKEGYEISDFSGESINPEIENIKWDLAAIEKGGYSHFMLKEIFEQPVSLANTFRGRVSNEKIKLSITLNPLKIKRIIITACGTSWHSSLIGKYFLEQFVRIPVEVDYASEFRYRNPLVGQDDLVIVLSQSGETADTLAALREARTKGAQTLGIVNVVGSTISREVHSGIYIHAGPEIGVASTKAFTSQIGSLLLLSLYLAQERGEVLDRALLSGLKELPNLIANTLDSSSHIEQIATHFTKATNFLYLGRGLQFPVALEGALKLKEISYIHAEGYPAAEMKHGPIALIDSSMPVVFIAPKDAHYEKIISNLQEVKARGGKIIIITDHLDERITSMVSHRIIVPKSLPIFTPFITTIPLQLLAYYIANAKGLDVDKPRNLAKSVTVE